ncbi:hypothetical protein CBM2634_A40056 [Cupriavidus taiwanensis]|uniref:Uncharacterized protein n=1 Tax=Cupriavidus taiwanensis TaxID=164546 RepID=A0A375J0P2_9BURK|nr:hypothetical protein CBM2634_A40056 [Cupriavidus taiwanensis]
MSLIALVAAMRPKSNGSSTMGMKKSVVETTPRWPSAPSSAYTAASSREALPTHRRGSRCCAPLPARITSSTLGEILQPQPAPWLYCVRRMGLVMNVGSARRAGGSGALARRRRLDEERNWNEKGYCLQASNQAAPIGAARWGGPPVGAASPKTAAYCSPGSICDCR